MKLLDVYQFLEEMDEESIAWSVQTQSRVPINKLFSEIKTNWKCYLIEDANFFLTEMSLEQGDIELAVRVT